MATTQTVPGSIGGLSTDQAGELQKRLSTYVAGGQSIDSARARVVDDLKQAGVYDQAKAAYNSVPAQNSSPVSPIPGAPATTQGNTISYASKQNTLAMPGQNQGSQNYSTQTGNVVAPTTPYSSEGYIPNGYEKLANGSLHLIDTSNPTPQNQLGNQTSVPLHEETTTVENTPTGTVTKKTTPQPSTAPTINYNVGAGREDQIKANLDKDYLDNQKIRDALNSGNRSAFDANYGYATADQTKKQLLDSFFQSHQPQNSQDMFGTLISGGKITDPNLTRTPQYAQAVRDYSSVKQFQNSSGRQIAEAVDAGVITEGTSAFDALVNANPEGMAQYKQIKEDKRISSNVNSAATGYYDSLNSVDSYDKNKTVGSQARQPSEVTNFIQNLSDKFSKEVTPDYAAKWKELITDNPEAQKYVAQVSDLTNQLRTNQQAQISIEDDIKARFPTADQSYIDAKIRESLKPIYKEQNNINIALDTAQGRLSYLTQNAKDQIDLEQKTFQDKNTQFTKQLQVAQMAIAQQNIAQQQGFQSSEAQKARDFQTKQTELQQAYANPSLDSSDPNIRNVALQKAVQSTYDTYKSLGLPGTPQQIASQIQQGVTDGTYSSASEGLQALMQSIQQRPGYNDLLQGMQSQAGGAKFAFSPFGDEYNTRTGELMNQNASSSNRPSGNGTSTSSGTIGNIDLSSLYNGKNGPAFANNNPGNIKDTSFGGTAGGQGGFTKFPTVETGVSALLQKIKYNQANGVNGVNNGSAYNGNMSIQDYFAKYAPASDGNDPKSYAQTVATYAGVPVTTPIKDVPADQLAVPIMSHENHALYKVLQDKGIIDEKGNIQLPSETSSGSGNAGATGGNTFTDAQILALRGALAKQALNGSLSRTIDATTAKNVTGNTGSQAFNQLQSMMSQYSKNPELTTQDKKNVTNIVNGNVPYSAKQDPQGYVADFIIQEAAKKGVDWNPNDFSNQNKAKLQFSIGKDGQAIAAADTAIDHMADYKEILAANGNTQIPAVNSAWNRIKSAFGLSGPVQLQVIANTVGDELANAYNINAESGKEKKAEDFIASLSPDQGAASVSQQIQLLSQRLQNLNDDKWKPIIGKDNPVIASILEKANKVSKSESSGSGGNKNSAGSYTTSSGFRIDPNDYQ